MSQQPERKLELNKAYPIMVERLNQGEPIIAPTMNWWESGVTFNAATIYLESSAENEPLIRSLLPMRPPDDPELKEGVVAIYYRARPEVDPGSAFVRSFIGLALFTPDLKPLYRYQEPVVYPSPELDGEDRYGVEDPRITRFGDTFVMVYCGVRADPADPYQANLCLAISKDLLHWEKRGIMPGDINAHSNKDGILFPDLVDGQYLLLHRLYHKEMASRDKAIRLAASPSFDGPWQDCGGVLWPYPNPHCPESWLGGGSVPINAGDRRYIEIYHTGNSLNETDREYDLGAVMLDFTRYDPMNPASLVTARLEPLMVPETPAELRSHSQLQVGNVLFACGSYEYQGWIYIIYGGADTYTLAARVRKDVLVRELEQSGLGNPYL